MATKLSPHFTLEEMTHSDYAIKHHINNDVNQEQYYALESLCNEILEPIREELGMPIMVSSGFRCLQLNTAINGSKTSQHLNGEAADIHCKDMKKMWNVITTMIKDGSIECGQLIDEFGLSWIHISSPTRGKVNEVLKATKKNGKTIYTIVKL